MRREPLIIFDLDGTLLQTRLSAAPAVQQTLEAHGLPVPTEDFIIAFSGQPMEVWYEWLFQVCGGEDFEALAAEVEARELYLLRTQGLLYDGALDVLDGLRDQGCVLACCSNGPVEYVETALTAHGVLPRLSLWLCRGMGYVGKTDLVADACAHLRDGHALFVIGDREDDMAAAHANGGLGIGAAYGFGGLGELDAADAMINQIGELPRLLDELMERGVE